MIPNLPRTYPAAPLSLPADADYHPTCPRRQAVDKRQRQVSGRGAARPLDSARPTERHARVVA